MAELISMRKAYGNALVSLGKAREDVVVLSADVANSDHSYMFEEQFPERFFNVGIAEQSLVDVGVGFAKAGKVPFLNTFSFLFATRAIEMIRTHLCYGRTNVKLMGAYGGLSDSFDGPTHHSITDIAILRSLPYMTVVAPSDTVAVEKLIPKIAEWDGPVFCRLCRNEVPTMYDKNTDFTIGKAHTMKDGKDVTLITTGVMLERTMQAAEQLSKEGIDARVIDMITIKPIDKEIIQKAAEETGGIVTIEEHSIVGGLGGAVAEVVTDAKPVNVYKAGVPDKFAETGPYNDLLDTYGLSINDIVSKAKKAVS